MRPELLAQNPLGITNNQHTIVVNFHQDFEASSHSNFLQEARVLVPGRPFQPCSMHVAKGWWSTQLGLLQLYSQTLHLSRKANQGTNTLAYRLHSLITATVKSFITLATGASGRIRPLDLSFMRPVFYHFANQCRVPD